VPELFAKDAIVRRINAEPAIVLGAGRALLLQIAHPAVAQGVADHSDFRTDPFGRLLGTMEALNAVVFGSEELALAIGRRVQQIHEHVVGPTYRADDIDSLVWVHATLCDSALDARRRFVGPIDDDDIVTYYEQMKLVARMFGVPPAALPPAWRDFRAYFDEMVATLAVTDVGRRLAADIVQPPLPLMLQLGLLPLTLLHRLVAIGSTPEPVRSRLGLRWTAPQRRALESIETACRAACTATPRRIRVAPTAVGSELLLRQAKRHMLTGTGGDWS
jgi:uncharacterized protein (DUF2236 family)